MEKGVKNQGKPTGKIDIGAGEEILGRIDMPEHTSAMKELDRGRFLFYVEFRGGRGISIAGFSVERSLAMIDYRQQVEDAHRKAFGQYFTPPKVAEFMVPWVLGSGKKSLFDPAFGIGAFQKAAKLHPDVEFSASEVDSGIIDFWRRASGEDANFVLVENYLRFWGCRHENMVCNPPYMKFQKFRNQDAVFREFCAKL